jgi:protein JSN1
MFIHNNHINNSNSKQMINNNINNINNNINNINNNKNNINNNNNNISTLIYYGSYHNNKPHGYGKS